MFPLHRAWQTAGERSDSTGAPSAIVNPSDSVPRVPALAMLGAFGRSVQRYWRQIREQWRNVQYTHELARREAELVRKAARRNRRRALVLLISLLNTAQRLEFRRYGYFHVTGGSSGERYRIRIDTVANIDVLHVNGAPKHRLCAGPVDVPVYAMMAGQLLYLQDPASEHRFLRHAKVHPVYPALAGIMQ